MILIGREFLHSGWWYSSCWTQVCTSLPESMIDQYRVVRLTFLSHHFDLSVSIHHRNPCLQSSIYTSRSHAPRSTNLEMVIIGCPPPLSQHSLALLSHHNFMLLLTLTLEHTTPGALPPRHFQSLRSSCLMQKFSKCKHCKHSCCQVYKRLFLFPFLPFFLSLHKATCIQISPSCFIPLAADIGHCPWAYLSLLFSFCMVLRNFGLWDLSLGSSACDLSVISKSDWSCPCCRFWSRVSASMLCSRGLFLSTLVLWEYLAGGLSATLPLHDSWEIARDTYSLRALHVLIDQEVWAVGL